MNDIRVPCHCGDPACYGYRLDSLGAHPFFVPFDKEQFKEGSESHAENDPQALPFGILTTSSWDFDGERTDLNDLLAVLWGTYLRCSGIANVAFLSEQGFALPSEMSSRALFPVDWGIAFDRWDQNAQKLLLAKTSVHMRRFIYESFYDVASDSLLSDRKPFEEPPWLSMAISIFSADDGVGYELQTRQEPQWTCLTAIEKGLTVAELSEASASKLRALLGFKNAQIHVSETRMAFRDEQLTNAVDLSVIEQLTSGLSEIDQEQVEDPLIIPLASNVIAIGRRSLISVATECGRSAFNAEIVASTERIRKEADFFMTDVRCVWWDEIPDDRFEEMIGELLKAEPGVVRVRQVGNTRESDDGRDFMVEWVAPHHSSLLNTTTKITETSLSQVREVLVQVKIRSRGVNRSDAGGLRDTIEHYNSDGMLFVAFPNVTTTLNDHLHDLRKRGDWWIDWWNKPDIEDRLRRNIDIAARYPDVVALVRN